MQYIGFFWRCGSDSPSSWVVLDVYSNGEYLFYAARMGGCPRPITPMRVSDADRRTYPLETGTGGVALASIPNVLTLGIQAA